MPSVSPADSADTADTAATEPVEPATAAAPPAAESDDDRPPAGNHAKQPLRRATDAANTLNTAPAVNTANAVDVAAMVNAAAALKAGTAAAAAPAKADADADARAEAGADTRAEARAETGAETAADAAEGSVRAAPARTAEPAAPGSARWGGRLRSSLTTARLRSVVRLVGAGETTPGSLRRPPAQMNRMLTVLACSSMLIGAQDMWNRTVINEHNHAIVVMLYFGSIVVLGVLALSVRTRRAMTIVDGSVLLVAALECVNRFYTVTAAKPPSTLNSTHVYYGTDEGSLIHMAARTLLHGGRIYGTQWPQIFEMFHVGTTPLMNGGAATGLDYPPLGPIFTALPMGLHLSHPRPGSPRRPCCCWRRW
ncbi:hypothetical protein GXW83_24820 [Streptacidiphilus sp. PB12-B1b]|uniref:hypothetical protein n=1 Tax=Streptacidiphilus sp. PB12-B1b TaxID=2705012 RepID=UPI0015F8C09F|nr:hypothetical protein [Streptacidiphilus sp. PB12-B1b]QMU78451.1 hypothetical protein GXW83_24820 [Streptacidiphilus sp. PB12-B1b]